MTGYVVIPSQTEGEIAEKLGISKERENALDEKIVDTVNELMDLEGKIDVVDAMAVLSKNAANANENAYLQMNFGGYLGELTRRIEAE